MTPFFSVVIPVHNRAHQIATALRSVLAQSEQDFEIVVVDDCSTDDPRLVLDAIGDPRIRYLRRERRGGGGNARNMGIDAAAGTFIAFLDSDDVFLPHHLAAMRALLEGTKDTIGYARMIVDRGDGREILKPPRPMMDGEHMATYLLCRRGFVPTITTVAPADWAKKIRYHADLPAAQDTDFALRAYIGGARFVMAEAPGAIWNDAYDPHRLSAGRKGAELKGWIEGLRSQIPVEAYYGCLGWAYAKYVARTSRLRALKLYLDALLRGAYPPRLAGVIFLQIFLPDPVYRAIADGAITWLKVGMRPNAAPAPEPVPHATELKRV